MVIVDYKAGQLANRLFQFSYFFTNAKEYRYKLINPCFEEYAGFFNLKSSNEFKGNIRTNFSGNVAIDNFITKKIETLRRYAKKKKGAAWLYEFHNIKKIYDQHYKEFDLNNPDFIKKAKKKIVFARGWNYRDHLHLKKYSDIIREVFTPKKIYAEQVNAVIKECKKNVSDILIGVHIRRGDYKNFFDGRWYFEDEVYFNQMDLLNKKLGRDGKRIVFLICSNQKINVENFKGLTVEFKSRHMIIDLYSLAGCDYILGPPSTFTMWASFYGKVPLNIIKHAKQPLDMFNFKVMSGVESFF